MDSETHTFESPKESREREWLKPRLTGGEGRVTVGKDMPLIGRHHRSDKQGFPLRASNPMSQGRCSESHVLIRSKAAFRMNNSVQPAPR